MLLPVNIYVLNQISWTLQSNTCQDPVAEQTESISFLTSWYVKTRHCKRQGERWHVPPLRASADHWQDSARCRQQFPFKKLRRWSYLIGFKCRIDARLCRCVIRRDLLLMDSDEFYHAVSPRVCVAQLRGCGIKCVPGTSGFITVLCSYICTRVMLKYSKSWDRLQSITPVKPDNGTVYWSLDKI